jgi:predicted transposase YdaD
MARRGLPTLEEALEQIGILPEMIERSERRGLKQGLEKGLEKGLEQGLETAARNALAEGASIEFVNKITGLDIETIKQLAIA